MTPLDIIRSECQKNGISLSKLEHTLNYGNGSLAKATNLPFSRMQEIADFFGKPLDYFRDRKEDATNSNEIDPAEQNRQRYIETLLSTASNSSPESIFAAIKLLEAINQNTSDVIQPVTVHKDKKWKLTPITEINTEEKK